MPHKDPAARRAYVNASRQKPKYKAWRLKNKERINAKCREWTNSHRDAKNETMRAYRRTLKGRYSEIKKKCAKINRAFTLSFKKYSAIVAEPCYYCDNRFGKPVEAGCGLDRINSNYGYSPNNVVSCCKNCNTVKCHLISLEEMKAVVALILQMREKKVS